MGLTDKKRCTLGTLKLMQEARALYLNGMTRNAIAGKLNLSENYVGQLLRSAGINHGKLPIYDKPEEIANCLACKQPECSNCLANKRTSKRG